jgi:hypothetical protein
VRDTEKEGLSEPEADEDELNVDEMESLCVGEYECVLDIVMELFEIENDKVRVSETLRLAVFVNVFVWL